MLWHPTNCSRMKVTFFRRKFFTISLLMKFGYIKINFRVRERSKTTVSSHARFFRSAKADCILHRVLDGSFDHSWLEFHFLQYLIENNTYWLTSVKFGINLTKLKQATSVYGSKLECKNCVIFYILDRNCNFSTFKHFKNFNKEVYILTPKFFL